MTEAARWRHDPTAAVVEDFGDEIVVMNPTSGAFYSLRGRAADLWRCCAAGATVADTEAAVAALDADEPTVLTGMLAEFQSTGILTVVAGSAAGVVGQVEFGTAPAQFTRNDDFNDLIRLDPIHDVDAAGWPFSR